MKKDEDVKRLGAIKDLCDELLQMRSSGGDKEHAYWLFIDGSVLSYVEDSLQTMIYEMQDELNNQSED